MNLFSLLFLYQVTHNQFEVYLFVFLLLYQVSTGNLKELFPTGKQLEPTVTRLDDDRLALGRDEMTIFIDSEGNPTQKYALTWSENPIVMGKWLEEIFIIFVGIVFVVLMTDIVACEILAM